MPNIVVCAMYKFVTLEHFEKLRQPLLDEMEAKQIRGTLLLALEGINGTVAGSREGIDGLLNWLRQDPRLSDIDTKESYTEVMPFNRAKVKSADFIGKAEYMKARDEKPAAIMCTLEMIDNTSKSGIKRFPTGGNEPILTKDGQRIVDTKGRVSRVTTAGAAPSLGKYLLLAYLTPEHAVEGNELRVMYMNEMYPVRVARVGSQPLFDPTDARMKS
jgi:hypothetical protein